MVAEGSDRVWVQVVDVHPAAGREISVQRNVAEELIRREDDIRQAIEAGSRSVARSLTSLDSPKGWGIRELEAKFGITLTAEAGVILTKASAEATFEISVKFTRDSS